MTLWSTRWLPPTHRCSTFYDFNRTETFYIENKKAYLKANPDETDTPSLHLSAADMSSLVDVFTADIRAANLASDFTLLLAHNCHFMM